MPLREDIDPTENPTFLLHDEPQAQPEPNDFGYSINPDNLGRIPSAANTGNQSVLIGSLINHPIVELMQNELEVIEEIEKLRKLRIQTRIQESAEFDINEHGGKQSFLGYRFDLIPSESIRQIAETLYQGSLKYSDDNWKKISTKDHINHALAHIYAELRGDTTENHLAHAATRLLFAIFTKTNPFRGAQ